MRVYVEEVQKMMEYRKSINDQDLKDIEWYAGGVKIEIGDKEIEEFKFTGLNNLDFMTMDFYKDEKFPEDPSK